MNEKTPRKRGPGRPARPITELHVAQVYSRLQLDDLRRLDAVRGNLSRSEFARRAVLAAIGSPSP